MAVNHSRDVLDDIESLKRRVRDLEANRAAGTGAWTPYIAVWTSTGTAPSLGTNGQLLAAYSKSGRTVSVRWQLFGGSATTWGTGTYGISLPFPANVAGVPSGQFAHDGTILAAVAGNGTFYVMGALIDQATPSVVNGVINGSGSFWGQGNPATWATIALAVGSLTYESLT